MVMVLILTFLSGFAQNRYEELYKTAMKGKDYLEKKGVDTMVILLKYSTNGGKDRGWILYKKKLRVGSLEINGSGFRLSKIKPSKVASAVSLSVEAVKDKAPLKQPNFIVADGSSYYCYFVLGKNFYSYETNDAELAENRNHSKVKLINFLIFKEKV